MNDVTARYIQIITQLIDNNKIKDGKDFALKIGVSVSSITEITKGRSNVGLKAIQKTISTFPEINTEWLITGEGEIFKTKTPENVVKENDHMFDHKIDHKRKLQKTWSNEESFTSQTISNQQGTYTVSHRFPARTDRELDLQRVPLYELEATAGLVGLFLDASSQVPVSYLSIPNLPRCDGAVYVRGDSMYPLLKSGDIVLYKQITDFNYIVWGEMYLISYNIEGDEYIAVKFINKIEGDPEHILLVSHNPHHAPAEIPISSIRALAMIKASVRYNTIG